MPNLDGKQKHTMEPTNQAPQTPAADAGAPAGQPPVAAPAPQSGDAAAQTPATPAAPANPEPGTGQTNPGAIRNNPDGQPAQPGDNVNYQEKFGESTKENQRLMALLQQGGIDPKTGQPVQPQGQPAPAAPAAPTQPANQGNPQSYNDDQLAAAIPGFNALSAPERDVIRYAKNTAKTIADLQRTVAEIHDERITNQQVDKFKADPNYKVIADNEKQFRAFAYDPENLNLDMEHVALKFTQGMAAGTIKPAAPEAPAAPVQPGMETGSGGAGQINGGGGDMREMTAGEAANLRKTDHREYNRLAKEGKLKIVSR